MPDQERPSLREMLERAPAPPHPWRPVDATRIINRLGRNPETHLAWSDHASQRRRERNLLVGDIRYVLTNGFVHEEAQRDQPRGRRRRRDWAYDIVCETPNSNGRMVRCIVAANPQDLRIKLITVMWRDEARNRR